MGRIYNNIVETVGHTPLVKLNKVTAGAGVFVRLSGGTNQDIAAERNRLAVGVIELAP